MPRVFVIPVRNDLVGVSLYVGDLAPNNSQKNNSLDGEGQTFYLREGLDNPGTTTVDGTSFVSGSRNTTLAADPAADDTTGGGNNVTATQATTLGLAAYLMDRVQGGGVANNNAGNMPFADCNAAAIAIQADAAAGNALTLAAINAILVAQVADTDLDGAAANSKSFGTVEDILRILSGEVYTLPRFTIIENAAGQFRDLAERQTLVDAQNFVLNGNVTFVASGRFLASGEPGFLGRPTLVRTGAFNASVSNGKLSHYNGNFTLVNPKFAYAAADVTAARPRAVVLDGAATAVAATGIARAVTVRDNLGNAL